MSKVYEYLSICFLLVCSCHIAQSAVENTTTIAPPPSVPRYKVKNGTEVCLLSEFNVQFTIPFFDKNGELQSKIFYINSSNSWLESIKSSCSANAGLLSLFWLRNSNWTLELLFGRVDSGLFNLADVTLNYTLSEQLFPQTNETNVAYSVHNNQSQFSCAIGSYYNCISKQTVKLNTDKSSYPEIYLSFSNFKAQAFRSGPSNNFVGSATTCNADYIPDKAVPIAVGVTLAILIIVALLTFILGSRFRQNGYAQI